jgi:hypothetical protein
MSDGEFGNFFSIAIFFPIVPNRPCKTCKKIKRINLMGRGPLPCNQHGRSLMEAILGSGPPFLRKISQVLLCIICYACLNLIVHHALTFCREAKRRTHRRIVPLQDSFSCSQLASHNYLLARCIMMFSSRFVWLFELLARCSPAVGGTCWGALSPGAQEEQHARTGLLRGCSLSLVIFFFC